MKSTFLLTAVQNGAKRIPMGLLIAVAVMFPHPDATAAEATINLGTASSFTVLAGTRITDTAFSSRIVSGDVGLSPGAGSLIGLNDSQVVSGTIYAVDATGPLGSVENPSLLTSAKTALTDAYTDAGTRTVPIGNNFAASDNQLGSKTLFPGVYSFGGASTANLIGALTLDANGVVDPVWIFLASSTLVTDNGSSVVLINGAEACDVFWRVGTSATIGTTTTMVGIIMAEASITMNTGANLIGAALARNAAVTFDNNNDITACAVPEPGTTALLGTGLVTLFAFRRRFFSRA